MVLAAGDYCPNVSQKCVKHMRDYEEEDEARERKRALGQTVPPRRVPERCMKFEEPAKCLSKERTPMRFCIDTYEWPNRVGELPELLVTWTYAKEKCESIGKRLCTGDEFNFACEGEDLRPYSFGYERDGVRCNMDKPYVFPKRKLMPYADCMQRKWCKDHLAELDQREPIGARPQCTSPFGAFDLNGNVNEWVNRPAETHPWRSGLKGGWWGPARARCRPMVIAHNENYAGYEVGFRCCKNAAPDGGN
jgi:formylglycine-generating enzyme required for sulfatase activity